MDLYDYMEEERIRRRKINADHSIAGLRTSGIDGIKDYIETLCDSSCSTRKTNINEEILK